MQTSLSCLTNKRYILCCLLLILFVYVPTSLWTSLTANNGGPRKRGPTSGMGQCLASGTRQAANEWSDVDHQDVLMCPRQQSEGDVISDIGESNSRIGPREVGPRKHTSDQ